MQRPLTRADVWAKLTYRDDDRSTGEVVAWHPLLAHSADVAAVLEALLTRTILRKRLARLAGWDDLTDVHVARLCVLAALHDAGKVNQGFQNRAYSGSAPRIGHVGPIIDVFNWDKPVEILEPLGVLPMLEWFGGDADQLGCMLSATWGHHGRPIPKEEVKRSKHWWNKAQDYDPIEGLRQLSRHVRNWFPDAFLKAEPFPRNPSFQHAFNGALTLADWIGSDDKDFFEFADDLERDPVVKAREQVSEAIDGLSLDAEGSRSVLDRDVGFDEILPDPTWDPHPIQRAVRDLPLHPEGSLTVLESDTGSGKTEAAIGRFMRLFQERLVDGMYFAVPTRTAAVQLYERVEKTIKKIFPEKATRPSVVQAVPGYIKADDVEAKRLPRFNVRWDEDLQHRGWAAEHPKRYLAGGIVVGTVDQVLLSTLQVNHAHMRAAALLRHFLVIDEVHASDVYMTHLMDKVLDHHLSAGGHALLMSATLGTTARIRLTAGADEPIPSLGEAENIEYPLLAHVGAARQTPELKHAASSGREKHVAPVLRSIAGDPEAIARLALQKAQKGARVLVIRNLVDDCIATQRALKKLAGERASVLFRVNGTSAPHHSRFAPEDRRRLDEAIEAAFGKKTTTRSVVAVATQTVEQSLDIDADMLITDLCPMDVLLQRIGRLHRHQRHDFPRPDGFETAQCVIVTPTSRDLSTAITGEGNAWKGPHGLGTVYDDLRTIEATWQVLEDDSLNTWRIPAHNRLLVERATHKERLEEIAAVRGEAWVEHERWVTGTRLADRQAAGYVEINRDLPFGQEGFPTKDLVTIKTRLGRDDYRVLLPEATPGPFGADIDELSVSEWQVGGAPEKEEAEAVTPFEGGFSFQFCGKDFRYDRLGLSPQSDTRKPAQTRR